MLENIDYIKAELVAAGKFAVEAKAELEMAKTQDKVTLFFIIKPLVVGIKGKLKIKSEKLDYSLFDFSFEEEILDRIEFKETIYLDSNDNLK